MQEIQFNPTVSHTRIHRDSRASTCRIVTATRNANARSSSSPNQKPEEKTPNTLCSLKAKSSHTHALHERITCNERADAEIFAVVSPGPGRRLVRNRLFALVQGGQGDAPGIGMGAGCAWAAGGAVGWDLPAQYLLASRSWMQRQR